MGGAKVENWDQSLAAAYSQLECLRAQHTLSQQQIQPCLEAEMFACLTRVYLDEENVRVRQKLKRKSSQRISRIMHETVGRFLSEKLPGLVFQAMDGLLFVKKGEQLVGVLKCIPDLGSYGAPSWNAAIARFANQYQRRYKLAPEQLLFVICSLSKSLDADHAKALTGIEVWSGTAFTAHEHRDALQAYIGKCVETMDAIPAPRQQLYFLSAKLHPNALACQLIHGEETSLPTSWLKPSVTELVHFLKLKL
jgi:hypothetical protein